VGLVCFERENFFLKEKEERIESSNKKKQQTNKLLALVLLWFVFSEFLNKFVDFWKPNLGFEFHLRTEFWNLFFLVWLLGS